MLLIYYVYFNCSKFLKKAHDLHLNKEKSHEVWEINGRKDNVDMKDARHEARGACKPREHIRHEST